MNFLRVIIGCTQCSNEDERFDVISLLKKTRIFRSALNWTYSQYKLKVMKTDKYR